MAMHARTMYFACRMMQRRRQSWAPPWSSHVKWCSFLFLSLSCKWQAAAAACSSTPSLTLPHSQQRRRSSAAGGRVRRSGHGHRPRSCSCSQVAGMVALAWAVRCGGATTRGRPEMTEAARVDRFSASSSPLAAASADAVPAPAGGCAHGCGSRPCRRLRLHDH